MLFLMGFVTGILQNPEFSLVVDPAPADPMITDTFIELATAFAIQPCEQISRRFVIVVIICAFVGGGGGSSSSSGGGGDLLSAQKTDLLDKLRSLTGGQVVAVTLDRVGKKTHIDTRKDHDEDGPDTTEVTIKQRETKDTGTDSIFENYPPQPDPVGVSRPSKFQYYQSDVKRVKKRQHKRQDRQLRDFVSVRDERRGAARL